MSSSNSSRDVVLRLNFETLGEADVSKLQTALQQLAQEGGDAAPEFQRLADEVSKLGEQSAAIAAFKSLAEQVDALRVKQEVAVTATAEMQARLDALRASTAALQATEKGATDALTAGQLAYVNATNDLRSLKAEYDNTGKQTAEYRSQLQGLTTAQNEARAALVTLRADQRGATSDTNDAEAALSKLETAYGRQTTASTKAAGALAAGEAALVQSVSAAEALSIATSDIATAEGQLVASYNEGVTAVRAYTAAQNEAAAALAETNWQAEAEQIVNAAEATAQLARETQIAAAAAQEMAAQASFEQAAADARRLVQAAEYVTFWKDALLAAEEAQGAATWQAQSEAIVNAAEATQSLAAAAQAASAAEAELASQAAFEKAANDAKSLNQAAEYVQFWEQSLKAAETAAAEAAQAAEAASSRIANAFKTVGVGSVESLEAEIVSVREAMKTLETEAGLTGAQLASAFGSGNEKIAALEAQIRQLNGTMTLGDKAAGLFKDTLAGQFAAGNLAAQGIAFVIQQVKQLASSFVESIVNLQKFDNAMNAIYKDTTTTANQFAFLQKVALESGIAVGSLQGSFIQFSASMNTANVPLAQSNALFEAVTRASGTLGLSSEEASGALLALSQMAAKGTVSMEELRQQLGDRLPGAMALVATGLGLTQAQLIKLVESGNLAAKDLFPALTQALQSLGGEVTGIAPSFNNLKTLLTESAQAAGESGWADFLTASIKALTVVVGAIVLPLTAFSEVIFGLAKSAGILVGALVTLTNPLEALKQVVDDAATRQAKLTAAFDGNTEAAKTNAAAVTQQRAAVEGGMDAIASLATVTATTSAGQAALNLATTLAGNASLSASQKWIQLNTALLNNLTALEQQAVASDKSAKAAQTEGNALSALATLRGNDQAALQASASATDAYVVALNKALVAHQSETEVLTVQKAAFLEDAAARGLTQVQIDQEALALDQKILKSQAETDQSKAAVAQAQIEAATRSVAAQAYKDNSAAVEQFRQAMVAADATVEAYRQGLVAGMATQVQLTQATIDASKAHALYNDALSDSVAKLSSVAALQAANRDVTLASLDVELQAANATANHSKAIEAQTLAAAQLALAQGDTARATALNRQAQEEDTLAVLDQITAIRTQIQVVQVQAAAKVAAAQATIAEQNALLDELTKTGNLTDAKLREIEATKAEAQAKLIAAGASKSVVQGLNDEINALYSKLEADEQAQRGTTTSTGTTNADTAARNANTDAINGQTSALQKQQGLSSTGLTKSDGSSNGTFNNALPLDQIFAVLDKRNAGTLTTADLDQVKTALAQAQASAAFLQAMAAQNAGSVSGGALQTSGSQLTTLQQLLASLTQQKAADDANAAGGSATASSTSTTAPTAGSTSHTVTINLGSNATTINTASATDSNALMAILQSLEQAKSTAS